MSDENNKDEKGIANDQAPTVLMVGDKPMTAAQVAELQARNDELEKSYGEDSTWKATQTQQAQELAAREKAFGADVEKLQKLREAGYNIDALAAIQKTDDAPLQPIFTDQKDEDGNPIANENWEQGLHDKFRGVDQTLQQNSTIVQSATLLALQSNNASTKSNFRLDNPGMTLEQYNAVEAKAREGLKDLGGGNKMLTEEALNAAKKSIDDESINTTLQGGSEQEIAEALGGMLPKGYNLTVEKAPVLGSGTGAVNEDITDKYYNYGKGGKGAPSAKDFTDEEVNYLINIGVADAAFKQLVGLSKQDVGLSTG